MGDLMLKGIVAGMVTIIVLAVGARLPRVGGLVVSLPITSIVVFTALWLDKGDMSAISNLARETVIFVLLGLVLFVPLIFARSWSLSYWAALGIGVAAALGVYAMYFWWSAAEG